MKTRIKMALPSWYPHQTSWALLAERAVKLPPDRGAACPDRARPCHLKPDHPRR